jgi:exodeoxyribonuclease VII large subunit
VADAAPDTPSPASPKAGANVAEFTVSELSSAIKRALEEGFGYVRLRGEVSGYRGPHASGHCYFALKDDKAKIEAVVWRGVWGKLKIRPEEGMEVIATGKISSFPGSSKYQIVIESLEPAGLGALMAQLEERKKKLAAEGLFDEAKKKPIPFLPKVVGIVTSPTGAVIRDMLHGFAERFPTHVVVWPVRVQGEGSAAEVAAAIRGFNALAPGGPVPCPDVLIVARGGGSLEDLWGFNDETVVRAVAESRLPVISAVGHETDWTLIDLVADARAPTPTKAAEWAVPKHSDLAETTGKLALRLGVGIRRLLEAQRRDLKSAARGLPRPDDLVALPRQRLDATANRLGAALRNRVQKSHTRFAQVSGRFPSLRSVVAAPRHRFDAASARLGRALQGNTQAHHTRAARIAARLRPAGISQRIDRGRERLATLGGRAVQAFDNAIRHRRRAVDGQGQLLAALSYQGVLARGYALVRDAEGRTIRRAAAVSVAQHLEIEFADGRVTAEAQTTTTANPPEEPPPRSTRSASPPKPRSGGSNQGSLF